MTDERDRLRALVWYGYHEMNAIKARDGAPEGVSPKMWALIVEAMRKELGDDATPWPPSYAAGLIDWNDNRPVWEIG